MLIKRRPFKLVSFKTVDSRGILVVLVELDHERLEWEELESSLYELEDHQSKLLEQKSQIDQKINGFSVKFKREKEIRQQKERHRQLMTLKELPELEFYQKMLALDIQSIRSTSPYVYESLLTIYLAALEDMMKFIYSNIDPNDWSKEYSFVIDVSSNSYNRTTFIRRLLYCNVLIGYFV